jgi:hypothetical protein
MNVTYHVTGQRLRISPAFRLILQTIYPRYQEKYYQNEVCRCKFANDTMDPTSIPRQEA